MGENRKEALGEGSEKFIHQARLGQTKRVPPRRPRGSPSRPSETRLHFPPTAGTVEKELKKQTADKTEAPALL